MGSAAAAWPDRGAALMWSRTLKRGNDCLRSLRLLASEASMGRILVSVGLLSHRSLVGLLRLIHLVILLLSQDSE